MDTLIIVCSSMVSSVGAAGGGVPEILAFLSLVLKMICDYEEYKWMIMFGYE